VKCLRETVSIFPSGKFFSRPTVIWAAFEYLVIHI